jgi:hypothetical protein
VCVCVCECTVVVAAAVGGGTCVQWGVRTSTSTAIVEISSVWPRKNTCELRSREYSSPTAAAGYAISLAWVYDTTLRAPLHLNPWIQLRATMTSGVLSQNTDASVTPQHADRLRGVRVLNARHIPRLDDALGCWHHVVKVDSPVQALRSQGRS